MKTTWASALQRSIDAVRFGILQDEGRYKYKPVDFYFLVQYDLIDLKDFNLKIMSFYTILRLNQQMVRIWKKPVLYWETDFIDMNYKIAN